MISVEEATRIVLENCLVLGHEKIDLENSLGRTLAEDIFTDTDLPPFDRVMMDGIAIRKSDFDSGTRDFRIIGLQRAGQAPMILDGENTALEIMTGAVLPDGADAIVPYEKTNIINGIAMVEMANIAPFQNIHAQAKDKKKGDKLIEKGCKISAVEIGVASSCGYYNPLVEKLPSIHIFSTGDELVEIRNAPKAHQIRRSNVYALQQLIKSQGIDATQSHIDDNKVEIKSALKKALVENDIVILSGGVSKGKFDLIPEVLEECGVKKLFHRIAQRPGKPMWFGRMDNKMVFAFPGNPVSTMMCATRYLVPFLRKCQGQNPFEEIFLKLDEPINPLSDLTFFAQVKINYTREGAPIAKLIGGNGSGDFSSLVHADAFVEIPPNTSDNAQNQHYRCFRFRWS